MAQHNDPIPFLTQIPDWRDPSRITYDWKSLWTLMLLGLLTAPGNILALSQWLTHQRQELCQLLPLPGIPAQATIYRFFWQLERHQDALQDALLSWVAAVHPQVDSEALIHLAADGKVLRGSTRPGERALSFLSLFLHALTLTVVQVPLGERHEARVLSELLPILQRLFGQHWSLTLDAAYTESALTAEIVAHGGQFFVPLKNNTPELKEWAREAFRFESDSIYQDDERRAGQSWHRRAAVQTQLPDAILRAFPAAQTLIRREHVISKRDGTSVREVRYAVSSRLLTARDAEQVWREHWGIENRSHARRDILFKEDACWTRKAAQSLSTLHGLIIALLAPHGSAMTALVRRLRLSPHDCWQLLRFGLA